MPAAIVRNVLPVVTSLVAALVLATGMPHGLVPEVAAAGLAAGSVASDRADWLARGDDASRRASGR